MPLAVRSLCLAALAGLIAAPAAAQDAADPFRFVLVTRPVATGGYSNNLAGLVRATADARYIDQKASQQREVTRQKKLETRKKDLEHIRWERDWKWQMLDSEQVRIVEHELKRSKDRPALTEIMSGGSLNTLVKELSRESRGSDSGSVSLRREWLDHVNLVATSGTTGLLRHAELPWPAMLQSEKFDDLRTDIEDQLTRARKEVATGKAPGATIERLIVLRKNLKERIDDVVTGRSNWTFGHALRAKSFIDELNNSMQLLNSPKEAAFLLGNKPEGRNVAEFVQYLRENGLKIGPAGAGDERHYIGLHDALVQEVRSREYARGQK